MKRIIALLTIAILFFGTGCKSYTSVVSYVQKNCVATKSSANGVTTVTYECGELYNTDKVKDKCSSIQICFDGASAKLSGKAVCNDSVVDIERLIKLAINRK